MKISEEQIKKYVDEGWITARKHNDFPYRILNYTAKTQYERKWDDFTKICRGLIIDDKCNIIARPFAKFFNYGEHIQFPGYGKIPSTPPDKIFDKLDGSLGILYQTPYGKWRIATRGSFHSEQARKANSILHTKYPHVLENLYDHVTYLFEIIYPENRIVVDYGDWTDLVLIAIIEKENGWECGLNNNPGFPTPNTIEVDNDFRIEKLYDFKYRENKEGFCLFWKKQNFRLKVKFEEYLELQKIMTGLTDKNIVESLELGEKLSEKYDIPEEIKEQVKERENFFSRQFAIQKCYYNINFNLKREKTDSRKDFAQKVKSLRNSAIYFHLYDGKNIDHLIWKELKECKL